LQGREARAKKRRPQVQVKKILESFSLYSLCTSYFLSSDQNHQSTESYADYFIKDCEILLMEKRVVPSLKINE
jgi:hypothetical protein